MKIRIALWLILATGQARSQVATSDSLRVNRGKIEKLGRYIILKLTQSSDLEKFAVLTSGKDIRLSPNAVTISGLSFSYRFLYLQVSYVPKFLPGNNDDAEKGKTRAGGLSLSTNTGRWYNQFSYSKTKGYYLENTHDYDPNWTPGDPYVQFPQLVFKQYQVISAFNVNKDYSVSAVTLQSERQIKSAGSFIPVFQGRYYINDDQSTPTPPGSTQKGNNLELLLGAGYHYTLVAKEKFYVSLGLTPGAGYVHSRVTTRNSIESVKSTQHNFLFRLDGRTGAGYNSRRFFTGVYVNFTASAFKQQHLSVVTENDKIAVQAFIGYRLTAPRWLNNAVTHIEKKLGM